MDKVIENFVSLKIDSSNNDNKQEKNKSKKGNRKQQQAGNNRQWTKAVAVAAVATACSISHHEQTAVAMRGRSKMTFCLPSGTDS